MRPPPTLEQSCASNTELVKIWHEENELKPEDVYLKSGKKIKWNCFVCNHIYEQTPDIKYRNTKCPYCATPNVLYFSSIENLYNNHQLS